MKDSFGKAILFIIITILFVWCFMLTFVTGNAETTARYSEERVNQLEIQMKNIQYWIENQPDTVVINIENNLKITNKN